MELRMGKKTNIQKRRRLEDLYTEGYEVRFHPDKSFDVVPSQADDYEPPDDDDIVVFVTPPNPLQREQVLREAQGARARAILKAKKDLDSAEALSTRAHIESLPDEELVDYILDFDESERRQRAQREILAKDEWEDFASLQDAMRQWEEAGSPEGEDEWDVLLERDDEFGRQVAQRQEELRETDGEALLLASRETRVEKALEHRIEMMGSQAFMREYENQMLFHACRDNDDRTKLFWDDVNEFKSSPEQVQNAVAEAYQFFISEVGEAKNSQPEEDGSKPSPPLDEPETSESSTPEPAVA